MFCGCGGRAFDPQEKDKTKERGKNSPEKNQKKIINLHLRRPRRPGGFRRRALRHGRLRRRLRAALGLCSRRGGALRRGLAAGGAGQRGRREEEGRRRKRQGELFFFVVVVEAALSSSSSAQHQVPRELKRKKSERNGWKTHFLFLLFYYCNLAFFYLFLSFATESE